MLVAGEAGIGKTSLVRAFASGAAERARVLLSACDDLMAPRTLGPLRDAAAGSRGPLAAMRQVNLSGVIVGKALYEKRFTIAEGQAALDGVA